MRLFYLYGLLDQASARLDENRAHGLISDQTTGAHEHEACTQPTIMQRKTQSKNPWL